MITVYGLNVRKFHADRPAPFFQRMLEERPDFICLQETNCAAKAFPPFAQLRGYQVADNFECDAPGHSGVAVLSRHPIGDRCQELCVHDTCRSRLVEVTVVDLRIASVYAHAHRDDDKSRWPLRERFNECFGAYMRRNAGRLCILVTDANVALTRADVLTDTQWGGGWANRGRGKYWNSIVNAIKETGWVDTYRVMHGYRRRATVWYREAAYIGKDGIDEGFGIDFQLVSSPLASRILHAEVLRPNTWSERFSDHAPTVGQYEVDL